MSDLWIEVRNLPAKKPFACFLQIEDAARFILAYKRPSVGVFIEGAMLYQTTKATFEKSETPADVLADMKYLTVLMKERAVDAFMPDIEKLERTKTLKAWADELKPKPPLSHPLYGADPNCDHDIISGHNGSGVRCSKCPGWFCY